MGKRCFFKKIVAIFLLLLAMFFVAASLSAEESNKLSHQKENEVVYPYHKLMVDSLMSAYRNYISPVNQSSCPMYPTCSGYAEECFRTYNPLIASLKTSDRLIRCANDLHNYDTINVNGLIRYYDPVRLSNKKSKELSMAKVNFGIEESAEDQSNTKKNDDELLYLFAKQLEVNNEYDSAIIEYKRLISYYPTSKYVPKAKWDIFKLLFNTEKYLDAIAWGHGLLTSESFRGIDEGKIIYYISLGYFKIETIN